MERDDLANGHAAVEGDDGAATDDAEAEDEERHGGNALDDVGEESCLDSEVDERLGLAAEAVEEFALEAESFDQVLRLQGLLDRARHAAFLLAHGEGGAVSFAEEGARKKEADGRSDHGGDGHARVYRGHPTGGHHDAGDAEQGVGNDGDEAAFNGLWIGDEHAQEVARLAPSEEIKRERLHVHIDVAAEIVDDARAELCPDVVGNDRDSGDEDGGEAEEAEEFDEARVVTGDDGLVDQKAEGTAGSGFEAGLEDKAEKQRERHPAVWAHVGNELGEELANGSGT